MKEAQAVGSIRAGHGPQHQRYADEEDEEALHESGTRGVGVEAARKKPVPIASYVEASIDSKILA